MKSAVLLLVLSATLALCACSQGPTDTPATEIVQVASLNLDVHANGALKATQSTPLQVPGKQWTPRQLVWLLADGSQVKKGELVARFSAKQSKQDLAEAELDLKRNTIDQLGKHADLGQTRGKLGVDLANVAYQLAIAERYANASFEALARNKVLDAVQDKQYLGTRQNVLQWRKGQTRKRGEAELAVLDAQRNTFSIQAKQKRADLDALELRAPHDGIFMLQADWSGQKPHIGTSLYAGRPLASLPDTAAMDIEIAVPQVQAQGITVGDAVHMHPLGKPDQGADTRISWIAAAAQTRSRESPVKFVMMKAKVPKKAITRYAWMPEQQFAVDITVFRADKAISVPNLAIDSSGDTPRVFVLDGSKPVARKVSLGARGASRTQIKDGLEAGERVLIDRSGLDKESS
ncbi:MAG: hypothetical protein WCD66_05915 [Rhodanobacteraceae bacterium]